jgi:hypothetical protein
LNREAAKRGGWGGVAIASLGVMLAACAPAATPRTPATTATTNDEAARFAEQEGRALRLLAATDRRIALRAGLTPSDDDKQRMRMGVILEEDPTTVILDGMPDTMSFDARKRALDEAERAVTAGAEPGKEPPDERRAFARFLAEERARLERERRLPRAASDIVRAIVETWRPPATPDAAAGRDQWLTRRLSDLRAAVASSPMTVAERDELDDALDPLEKQALGLTESTKALTALRLSLGDVRTIPGRAPDERELLSELDTFLDWRQGKTALADLLRSLEAELRAAAEPRLAALDRGKRAEVAKRVAELMLRPMCERRPTPGSALGSMRAPPERAGACAAVAALCEAPDADAGLPALVALHDWAVLATWAMHGAPVGGRLLAELESEEKSDATRLALVRPVVAIGAALYAREVTRVGAETRARACAVRGMGGARLEAIAPGPPRATRSP